MLALVTLVGCANPISNDLFYQDEAFLTALPSEQRIGVPEDLLDANLGSSTLLAQSAHEAENLELLLAPMLRSATIIRATPPDERSDAVMRWDPVTVTSQTDAGVGVWYVRASITQPTGSDAEWVLEVADSASGDFVIAGSGRHDPGGHGTMTWFRDTAAEIVGSRDGDAILVTYEDDFQGLEDVSGSEIRADGRTWGIAGGVAMSWSGVVGLTDDGLEYPAVVQLIHSAKDGGRAEGQIFSVDDDLDFEACWDRRGDETWLVGDGDVTAVGAQQDCTIDIPW